MEVFFIADTHFRHRKLVEGPLEPARPFDSIEEHDEALIANWNNRVNPSDLVWHLGDVAMWKREDVEIIRRLNGRKRLVLGNHDNLSPETYKAAGFEKVYMGKEKYGGWLSHIPIHASSVDRYGLNIHGHLHHREVMTDDFIDTPLGAFRAPDFRYICVSADQIRFTPISLTELRGKIQERRDQWDGLKRASESQTL